MILHQCYLQIDVYFWNTSIELNPLRCNKGMMEMTENLIVVQKENFKTLKFFYVNKKKSTLMHQGNLKAKMSTDPGRKVGIQVETILSTENQVFKLYIKLTTSWRGR